MKGDIYRKPTFTGQHICWNSLCTMKQKINLILTLVHRALVICSESTLQNELFKICTILINNGYLKAVINNVITKKMNQCRRPTQLGSKKCPVYLHLPLLGNLSMRYEMQIKTAVKRCYFAVEPRIVYTTRQYLPAAQKDVLPASCKPIRSIKAETSFSAIGHHVLQNPTRACKYNDGKFSIFARGLTSLHLSTLEATYIKTVKPNLCKQKEFVCNLKIALQFSLCPLATPFTYHDEASLLFFLFR